MSRRALFLDRDGVLNVDHGYVHAPEDFEPVPGVFEALRDAVAGGWTLVVVTNQSGIGRGYYSEEEYQTLEAHMRALFAGERIEFLAIYHCPHLPDAGCACRKPAPGMILQAAREHDLDLPRSAMIGDKPSDAEAARAAGVGVIEMIGSDRTIRDIVSDLCH